jgi:hypothetical protein
MGYHVSLFVVCKLRWRDWGKEDGGSGSEGEKIVRLE